jgi:glycopeptide antibiotics resistance protein
MAKLIMYDVITAVRQFALYPMISGIFIIAMMSTAIKIKSKQTFHNTIMKNRKKLLVIYLFYIYCFLLVCLTYISREPGSRTGVNLLPLGSYYNSINSIKFIVENVLLFIPLGFMLPLLFQSFYSVYRSACAGFVVSIVIEFSQLVTERGYFQTDDIILNVLGNLIGLAILRGCKFFHSGLAKL